MIPILSVEAMRESDARTIAGGTPGRDLMRRAAHSAPSARETTSPTRPFASRVHSVTCPAAFRRLFSPKRVHSNAVQCPFSSTTSERRPAAS